MPRRGKTTPQIEESCRRCTGINEQAQALVTIETTGGTLTAERLTGSASLRQQFTGVSAKMGRLEAAERIVALVAKPVRGARQAPSISVKAEPKQYTGAGVTRLVMSTAAIQGNAQNVTRFAAEELNGQAILTAISTASVSDGILTPQSPHSEVIELLRDHTIVRKLDARSTPLPNSNVALPHLVGGTMASYTREGEGARTLGARFDDVELTVKAMIAMVPISNRLTGHAGYSVEQLILQGILTVTSVRGDKALIRDDGTSDTPVGMKARATEWSRLLPWEAAAEIDLQTIDTYFGSIILMAVDRNNSMISCGWDMSSRIYMELFGLRDDNGNKIYPEMAQEILEGFQIQHTNATPTNLDDAGKRSETHFTDFDDVVIGEDGNMKVPLSQEASCQDGGDNLASAFSHSQSLIRVATGHDIGFRYPEGLVLGTKVLF